MREHFYDNIIIIVACFVGRIFCTQLLVNTCGMNLTVNLQAVTVLVAMVSRKKFWRKKLP